MILVRTVFQAKFGRAGELAAAMRATSQAMNQTLGADRRWRLLTDLSGPFDTVVLEVEAESLTEWEQVRGQMFSRPEFQESFARTQPLIESGRNELYTIEAQG